ncbi:MAG: hypothetical protein JW715_06890 [Sedimentisphaerales bacterium]|nr:hypothetical protein [Sedimentisphaerales bacterium]
MYRRLACLLYFIPVLIMVFAAPIRAAVPIEVENYSFELPDNGQKLDIEVGTPGRVTGWARTDPTTSAGREYGWTPTDGTATAFMGKDAVIYNLTDFLMMAGDAYQLIFDSRSTWQGSNMIADLYYDDEGERIVFATLTIDLSDQAAMATFTMDSDPADPNVNDHKLGIQFTHQFVEGLWPDDNIWAGLDWIELKITSPLMRAQNPYPEHESSYGNASVDLTWVAGPNAPTVDSYHVYFNENRDDVANGTAAADKGSIDTATFPVADLAQGQTYHWRVDTIINGEVYRGNIWTFTAKPSIAYNPNPAADAEYVSLEPVLSWEAGSTSAKGHIILFGDDFDSVNNTPPRFFGGPPFRTHQQDQTDVNWAPSESGIKLLETSKTYYWRIDSVDETSTIHKGDTWSFTTVPIKGLGSITRELYESIAGGTVAELTEDPNFPDNPSTTGYLTSFEAPHMSISEYGSRIHGWLYVRNSGEYTFWVASGENSQLWFGDHPSTASIIAYVDGEDGREGWTQPREWDKYPEIQQSEPIYLQGGGTLYYIMTLHKKGWGYDNLSVAWSGPDTDNTQQIISGTSLIPFEEVELLTASAPNPAHLSTDVYMEPTISWVAGEYAAQHQIYFGTDANAVSNATIESPEYQRTNELGSESYNPGILEFNTTYYWRIDEVNDNHPDVSWKGKVWSFKVGSYYIVDDFESYNDIQQGEEGSKLVYLTWTDGYDNPSTNGSTIGYVSGSSLETDIVHGGNQSVPLMYNNTVASISEVTINPVNLAVGGDWAAKGADTLSLWFYGDPNNPATEKMYVKVNDAKAVFEGDLTLTEWQEFPVNLTQLNTNLGNVTALKVGFERTGTTGNSGIIYLDDIRLYLPEE